MTNFTDDGKQGIPRGRVLKELLCQKTIDAIYQASYAYNSFAALSALNIVLSITTILGNTLIMFALHKETSLHPPTKVLFRCLAATDLCVGLVAQPLAVAYMISILSENLKICMGILATTFSGCIICCAVSIMILTSISVDRLLALLLGLRYRQVVTVRRVLAVVILFWVYMFANGAIIFIWPPPLRYTVGVSISYFLLCVAISTVCYVKIFLKLRNQQAQVQEHLHQEQINGNAPTNIRQYRKTLSAVFWFQLTLFVCYLPSFCFIGTVRGELHSFVVSVAFVGTFAGLNSLLNPIVYCWKIREVRQAMKEIIGKFYCLSN